MSEQPKTPFIPGFLTANHARKAGREFFARTNCMPGKEGRHFHVVQNQHGRWHFEEGPTSKEALT